MFPNQGYNSMMMPQNMGGYSCVNQMPVNPMNQGLSSTNAGCAFNPQMQVNPMSMMNPMVPVNPMNPINQMAMPAQVMSSQRMNNMSFNEMSMLNQKNPMGINPPEPQPQPQPQAQTQSQNNQNIPGSSDPIKDLMNAATVKIDQRSNFCKLLSCAFCGCENIYDVIIEDTSKSQKHLFELEEKNCCLYHCCVPGMCRGFNMEVKAISEKDGKKTSSPLAFIERPCKLGCLCLCRPELTIKQGNGVQMGKVDMPCNLCGSEFQVYNEKMEKKYIIKLGCCQCGLCCVGQCCNIRGDIFEVTSGALVGVLTKDCSCLHCCTKADTYHLNFPNNATFNERINLISAVMLIDYRLFE